MAHFVDWFLGLLTPAQWESWRNWVATVGGLIALSIATLTYRRNVRLKREEQARLVYAQTGGFGAVRAVGDAVGNRPGDGSTTWVGIRTSATGGMVAADPILQIRVTIFNASKELIGPIRIRIVDRDEHTFFDDFEAQVQDVRPETEHHANLTFRIGTHEPRAWLGTDIQFRDASGQWWGRHLSEPIKPLRARRVAFEYR